MSRTPSRIARVLIAVVAVALTGTAAPAGAAPRIAFPPPAPRIRPVSARTEIRAASARTFGRVSDARLRSLAAAGGDVTATDGSTITASVVARSFTVPEGATVTFASGVGVVVLDDLVLDGTVRAAAPETPSKAPGPRDSGSEFVVRVRGEPGADAAPVVLRALDGAIRVRSEVRGADGAAGESLDVAASAATGGPGGAGGDLVLRAREVEVTGILIPGRGGAGGEVHLDCREHRDDGGGRFIAQGGSGGRAGRVLVDATKLRFRAPDLDPGRIVLRPGGAGGDATCIGGVSRNRRTNAPTNDHPPDTYALGGAGGDCTALVVRFSGRPSAFEAPENETDPATGSLVPSLRSLFDVLDGETVAFEDPDPVDGERVDAFVCPGGNASATAQDTPDAAAEDAPAGCPAKGKTGRAGSSGGQANAGTGSGGAAPYVSLELSPYEYPDGPAAKPAALPRLSHAVLPYAGGASGRVVVCRSGRGGTGASGAAGRKPGTGGAGGFGGDGRAVVASPHDTLVGLTAKRPSARKFVASGRCLESPGLERPDWFVTLGGVIPRASVVGAAMLEAHTADVTVTAGRGGDGGRGGDCCSAAGGAGGAGGAAGTGQAIRVTVRDATTDVRGADGSPGAAGTACAPPSTGCGSLSGVLPGITTPASVDLDTDDDGLPDFQSVPVDVALPLVVSVFNDTGQPSLTVSVDLRVNGESVGVQVAEDVFKVDTLVYGPFTFTEPGSYCFTVIVDGTLNYRTTVVVR